MAPKADKRINVSGTVTPELHEFLEEHRWTNRLSKSDVVNAALVSWAEGKGFKQPEAASESESGSEAAKPAEPEPAKPAKPAARR